MFGPPLAGANTVNRDEQADRAMPSVRLGKHDKQRDLYLARKKARPFPDRYHDRQGPQGLIRK
eukprot:9488228-Pyramimonas_sp.AAC.1